IQPLFFGKLHRHVGCQDVAGVVKHHEQNPGSALSHSNSFKTSRRSRSGKDLTGHTDVQHSLAYESAQTRFVSASSQRHDTNSSCPFGDGSDHQVVAGQPHFVVVGKGIPL